MLSSLTWRKMTHWHNRWCSFYTEFNVVLLILMEILPTVSMAVELNQYWVLLKPSIQLYFCPKVLGEVWQSRCSFIATGAKYWHFKGNHFTRNLRQHDHLCPLYLCLLTQMSLKWWKIFLRFDLGLYLTLVLRIMHLENQTDHKGLGISAGF